jgi:hypothetical protein
MRTGSTRPCRALLCLAVALSAGLSLAHAAHAADSTEFWPELNAFVTLGPRTRLFLDAAYADGKETDRPALDLGAYLDISLKPIKRKLRTEDWQRSRYFWARIGYDRVFKGTGATVAEVDEDRGIVSFYGKALLPAEFVAEARVRADLRWIGGDYSTRYRFRIEVNREFTVRDHTVLPYFNVEWFYDTRYDGWARTLYTLSTEVTVDPHFRYEIYLARQNDRLPEESNLDALGVMAKWYY